MNILQDALNYLNYCEKNGVGVDIDGLTDKEIIELSDKMQGQADAAYDAWKEKYVHFSTLKSLQNKFQ